MDKLCYILFILKLYFNLGHNYFKIIIMLYVQELFIKHVQAPLTFQYQGPVSRKILSLEMDLSPLITLVTIVFSMLKITRGLKIFWETGPSCTHNAAMCVHYVNLIKGRLYQI